MTNIPGHPYRNTVVAAAFGLLLTGVATPAIARAPAASRPITYVSCIEGPIQGEVDARIRPKSCQWRYSGGRDSIVFTKMTWRRWTPLRAVGRATLKTGGVKQRGRVVLSNPTRYFGADHLSFATLMFNGHEIPRHDY